MLLYNLGVRFYGLAIRAASPRSPKAKEWVRGRRDWRKRLHQLTEPWKEGPRIWVHCASYGEFEQGRPVIEALRKKFPTSKLVLTFFSPSGYEPFKNWQGADAVLYLPLDTPRNAAAFIDILEPSAIVFIKYEFWLNYLREIRRRAIPCYLVSAVFKQHHPFFRWYGNVFRKSLATFRTLFIQDQRSGQLLESIGINNYKVTGDTRFDRVVQIRNGQINFDWLGKFRGQGQLIVAGSTWERDDLLIFETFARMPGTARLLLVPHDVSEKSIDVVVEEAENSGLSYSLYSKGIDNNARVLILDTVGLLSRCYAYGSVAYIGGGFDGGIHNSLEPAVFGLPITFYGNDYTKFNEAVDLLAMGAAVNVKNSHELETAWKRLLDPGNATQVRKSLEGYFAGKGNSSALVVEGIEI